MRKCYLCYYSSRVTLTCDYCLIEKKSRGTPVEMCDKYKPRKSEPIDPYAFEIEELYYKGMSDRAIARQLGISRYKVYTWRTAYGLEPKGEASRGRPRKER